MENRDDRADDRLQKTSNDKHDELISPIALGYIWASRILTVCLEMVVPGVLGLWVDSRLATSPAFTLVGFGGGLILGVWHLLKMVAPR